MPRRYGREATIGGQVLGGYLATLVVLAAVVVVALVALTNVSDVKGEVIEREVPLVVGALEVRSALAEKAAYNRSFILTSDESYRTRLRERDHTVERLLADMDALARTDTGRRYIDELRDAEERWDEQSEAVLAQVGTMPPDQLGRVAEERMFTSYEDVQGTTALLIDFEQQRIDAAEARADDSAKRFVTSVLALGALAVIGAAALGTFVTRRTNRRLAGFALNVDAAAAQLVAGSSQQAAGAAQQATAVQQTVTTVEQLAQAAGQSAERARSVAEGAQHSASIADAGTEALAASTAAMTLIRSQVDVIAETNVRLATQARAISDIIATVDEIAAETHLLAINASVEAARAGEHGRGFAVVASEVRALADQAKRATRDVAEILGEIQRGTDTAVAATAEGTASVTQGASRVEEARQTIEDLAKAVAGAALASEQIAASSTQQAAATAQIGDAMRSIDEVTEQSVASARQLEQAAIDLRTVATELKALVGAR